jgi:ABC-type transport system substrate-binding protein
MRPPAGWNVYHFCSPELDAAEGTALTSYDRVIRANAYAKVQRVLAEQLPFYVLWYQLQIDVVNADFQNYKPAHAVTPFWNVWQWEM